VHFGYAQRVIGVLPAAGQVGQNAGMDTLNIWQAMLMGGLGLILAWLVLNGLRSGSVWVRGVRDAGSADPRDWATAVSRQTSPLGYWLAIGFYSAALLFVLWALIALR